MAIRIETRGDVLRRTGKVMVIAASMTAVMSFTIGMLVFGRDLAAPITVGQMQLFGLTAGVFISIALSGAMSYRAGLLMLELAHTRRELQEDRSGVHAEDPRGLSQRGSSVSCVGV